MEAIIRGPVRINWGGVIAGSFIAAAVWILLYTLGLSLGLSSVDPANPSTLRGAGIGSGLTAVIAPLIALFAGGMFASRASGAVDRFGGALHGAVVWALTTVGGLILVATAASMLIGGAASMGGKAASALGKADLGQVAQSAGLNADDALKPINAKLQQEGKPPVEAKQLEAATKEIAGTAATTGKVDRETLVGSIARETKLSRADAEQLADRVEAQVATTKDQVTTTAAKAVDKTGKAFGGIFVGLLLGLISALVGGSLGVVRKVPTAVAHVDEPHPTERRPVYP